MIELVRTNSENTDFIRLVKKLDDYLKTVDGDDHEFYNQYNNIDVLNHVIMAYSNGSPLGCGAFKAFNNDAVELKRMFIRPESRGRGTATKILKGLEIWAKELFYTSCILETGKRQIEAANFYKKNGYTIIPNYGPYKNITNSLCFKKTLF